ncbi:uncharacterized protein LOC144445925 [Glandiceps talaboti]
MAEQQTPRERTDHKNKPTPRRSPRTDMLPRSEQRRIEKIHAKVDETKETIDGLRKRLYEKEKRERDRKVRREVALRRAAEKRQLDTSGKFVDMYAGSDPSVMEELKHRLAPATRRHKMREGKSGTSDRHRKTPPLSEDDDYLSSLENSERGSEHEDSRLSEKRGKSHSSDKKKHSRDEEDEGSYLSDGSYYSDLEHYPESEGTHRHSSHHRGHKSSRHRRHRRNSLDDRYSIPVPTPVFYYPDYLYDRNMMHRTFPPPFHSPPRRGPLDESQIWPDHSPQQNDGFGPPNGPLESTRKMGPQESSPVKPVQTYNVIQVADLETTLPSLVNELDEAKELNRKLSDKLMEAEREIESLKLAKSLAEASTEAEIAAKGAALIEEIYRAQKQRDAAVMARLRIANEERDEAILRLKKLEMARDTGDSGAEIHSSDEDISPTDTSMNELLSRLTKADGGEDIDKYGYVIMDKISLTKDRKKRITSEEMRAILDERDIALAKCKKLEQELGYVRKRNEALPSPKNNQEVAGMRAQLQATQQERNVALTKVRKLEDELQTLSVYYSLHKSLSQEQNLRDQFNNTLGSFEDEIKVRDEYLVKSQKDKNELTSHLQQAMAERNTMAMQYQQALHAQKEAGEKSEKLERLVNVLRKKLTEGTPKIVS